MELYNIPLATNWATTLSTSLSFVVSTSFNTLTGIGV